MNEALRKIVRNHIWAHNSKPRDGQGRPYGWTDEEIDALIKDVVQESEKGEHMSITLEKCANKEMHESLQLGDFEGKHTDRGERVCDWCAGMWGCDCH